MNVAVNPLAPGRHEISVNGIRQVYQVAGRGPICVAHPGGPGATAQYLRMPLVEKHLTMVYIEPVGTGDSGRLPDPDGYTVDAYTELTHGLIEQLGQERTYLLGHSYGGFVAQTYALRYPDDLAGLILYDTAPVAGPQLMAVATANVQDWVQEQREHSDEAAQVAKDFHRLINGAVGEERVRLHRAVYPLYLADYWGDLDRWKPRQAARHLWTVSSGHAPPFDARAQLPSLRVPTLVIAGRHDFICGVRWAEQLSSTIPDTRMVILENSGHFGHVEEPEEFASAVATFRDSLV